MCFRRVRGLVLHFYVILRSVVAICLYDAERTVTGYFRRRKVGDINDGSLCVERLSGFLLTTASRASNVSSCFGPIREIWLSPNMAAAPTPAPTPGKVHPRAPIDRLRRFIATFAVYSVVLPIVWHKRPHGKLQSNTD